MKIKKSAVQTLLHIIVLVMFFIVFGSVFYNNGNRDYKTESALMKESVDSEVVNGVFIRDETIVTYNGTGAVSYNVPDGGRLGKGSVIAEIYSSAEQIQINRQIQNLEEELSLLKKIQNPGTIESAQPSNLSVLIEEQYRNLTYYRDLKNYEKIEDKKENLLIYMSTYQLITDSEVNFVERIADITSQINNLKLEVSKPEDTILAQKTAYFVSYCDGYEDTLKKSTINELTIDFLRSVKNNKVEDGNSIGKVLDDYEWYIAGIVDNTNKTYEAGQNVTLKMESAPYEYHASVLDIRDEGNPAESIIVLVSDEFDYDLVQHRCERTEIVKGVYNGLKVPRTAIRFKYLPKTVEDEEGNQKTIRKKCKGVYILQGEQVVFREIDVIYEGSDYVLSNASPESEKGDYLALYDDIIVEGMVDDTYGE